MLFSQLQFWGFFAVVFSLYAVLPHRWQNWMLLVASYIFYGAWDWRFLGLILFSSAVDYMLALGMEQSTSALHRKRLLYASLIINLGVLCIFKYLGFFVESFTLLLANWGVMADPIILSIILPVGISFFTFQSLSYTIDVYRRELTPTHDFFDFALFVAFFPQLVAGPIERASALLPAIQAPRRITWEGMGRGTVLCLIGLIKKIVIADGIGPSVDAIYGAPNPSGADVLIATWLFAIQIYCDFSGYTDIARGVAKMLGFNLMLNFAQPYFATNPQEFWRRWHISLSTWLRDYLYIPLGGSKGGRLSTYRNLMLTMVLGGLWHGAAWNFVAWGTYQGALLGIHRAVSGPARASGAARKQGITAFLLQVISAVLFFQLVCYGWLLFRSRSFVQISDFTERLLQMRLADFHALSVPALPLPTLLGITFLFVWDILTERNGPRFYARWPLGIRAMLYAGMIYLLAFGATTATSAFIYFQF